MELLRQIFYSPLMYPHVKYAHTVSGGAGGHGTRISAVSSSSSMAFEENDRRATFAQWAIANEKITMQQLNERLDIYMDTVKNLMNDNSKLEIKIREVVEKRGTVAGKDYSKYNTIITELRKKIVDVTKDNAQLVTSLGNARLTSEDFRAKMEYEIAMRQAVEADLAGLRKILDDTNVARLCLESDIKSLQEELITLKKYHESEMTELRTQITQVGVRVDVDTPKGQDLSRILEDMRSKYEQIIERKRKEVQEWHEKQIKHVKVQVTESTEGLKEATTVVSESRRRHQKKGFELQAELNWKASREASLHDTVRRNNMELEKHNDIIMSLTEELTKIHNKVKSKMDIKEKLEAEIAEYRRLLDGGLPMRLEDAVDYKMEANVVRDYRQTIVGPKVVSKNKDVKST